MSDLLARAKEMPSSLNDACRTIELLVAEIERLRGQLPRCRCDDSATCEIEHLREECAGIAESHVGAGSVQSYDEACSDIAEAIRDTLAQVGISHGEKVHCRCDDSAMCEVEDLREQLVNVRTALMAAKEFADDEFSDANDLPRKARIAALCERIDVALTDEERACTCDRSDRLVHGIQDCQKRYALRDCIAALKTAQGEQK